MRPSAAALGVLLLHTAPASTLAQPLDVRPDLSWADLAALHRGDVQVRTGKNGALVATIDAAVRIEAAPKAIWDVLTTCEVAPEYVRNVKSCSLVETVDGGRSQLFVQTVKPAFFLPSFEHVFRLDYEPYRRIDVSRISGPIRRMEGRWWLLEQPGGAVILVHYLELDPGMPVPRFLVRAALKRDLPRVLEAVRERAENASAR